MRHCIVASAGIGNVFDDVGDVLSDIGEGVADVATSIVDGISDAGHAIGAVLKFLAPIVALYPGIGTALSVALSAAAAYASGDAIEDAIVDVVSNAIPGGVPRVAFNVATDITRTAIRGGDVKEAGIRGLRSAAGQVGGERAVAAFDTGLAVARGAKIQDAPWRAARATIAMQNNAVQLAAFDAAIVVKNGGDAGDAAIAAGRVLAGAGGPIAVAAYDAGVAIARGKDLQDAGFAALRGFSAGNDLSERAEAFVEKLVYAKREGKSVKQVLEDELVDDVEKYGALAVQAVGPAAKRFVAEKIEPIIQQWSPDWGDGEMGSYALAAAWNVAEPLARAAQAIMRDIVNGGVPDQALLNRLTKTGVQTAIEKYGAAVVASKATNETWTATKATFRSEQLELLARMPVAALSYAAAKGPQSQEAQRVLTSGASLAPSLTQAPAPSSPRSGVASDVALGGVIAAAAVALVWWAKS